MVARFAPPRSRARVLLLGLLLVAAALVFTQLVLPGTPGGARGTPTAKLFQGVVAGMLSALAATGLILVYRTTRIINFAVVALGTLGAEFTFRMVQLTHVPFMLNLLGGLLLAALVGLAFDLIFGRRFFNAPRLVLTVVTIAVVGVVLQARPLILELPFFPDQLSFEEFFGGQSLRPLLPFSGWDFHVGKLGLPFGFPEVFALEMTVLTLLLVGAFLRYTKAGVAVRAMAENAERAELLGISTGALSSIVWTIAGLLAGVSVILTGFIDSPAQVSGLAPGVLVPALAAAAIARFRSLGVAVVTAVLISVVSRAVEFSYPNHAPLVNVGLLVVLVTALLLQRRGSQRGDAGTEQTWQATDEIRPVPKELTAVSSVRLARIALYAIAIVGVVAFPFIASTGPTVLGSNIALTTIVGLSVVVLTGWAGQVSLGQWGFTAVGAVLGAALGASVGLTFWLAVPLAAAASAVVAVLVGLPALRIRGLFLLPVTFAFSVVVATVVLNRRYFDWLIPRDVERPALFLVDFQDERSMYFLCVGALLVAIVLLTNLRRSRVGRLLIASRENEANLESFGVNLVRTKLLAFAISGALAGFAGAVYVYVQRGVDLTSYGPAKSVTIFLLVIVGGVTSIGGALLGSLYFSIFDYVWPSSAIVQFLKGFSVLAVLYAYPSGLMGMLTGVRDSVLRIIAQRRQIIVPSLFADIDPDALEQRLIPLNDPSAQVGLAALAPEERYAMASELYAGRGERIIEKLAPARQTKEAAAIGAAVDSSGAGEGTDR